MRTRRIALILSLLFSSLVFANEPIKKFPYCGNYELYGEFVVEKQNVDFKLYANSLQETYVNLGHVKQLKKFSNLLAPGNYSKVKVKILKDCVRNCYGTLYAVDQIYDLKKEKTNTPIRIIKKEDCQ